jgi:parvulin-like peptidyl-prolyl isomerase
MKRFIAFFAAALALATSAACAFAVDGKLVDGYAAIVNGKVITVGDVLRQLQPALERLAVRHQGEALARRVREEYQAVRDTLVDSELILLDFQSQGGSLPDRAIEDHVNSVIFERFQNDRAAFLRALAEERLTFAEWRKQMKDQLIVQMMLSQTVQAKILVTPFDVAQAYQQRIDEYSAPARVHLRMIAFASADEAEEARAKLAQDEPLEAVADETGWYATTELVDEIRDAVSPLADGESSDPIPLGDRFYLVQLLGREQAAVRPLEEVAQDIERDLRRAEYDRLRRIWLDALRSKYFVQLFAHDLFD